MKKLLSFFAALLFAGSMVAETVTLTMSDFQATAFMDDNSGISVATAKEGGTTAPAYNEKAGDLRVYAKGTVTISASQNITAIEFVISSKGKYRLAELTPNVGEMTVSGDPDWEAKWSGEAKEVVITVGEKATYGSDGAEKAGQLCFDAINVTLEGGTIIDPQPKYEDGFYLVGDFTEWSLDEKGDYKLEANPNAEGEYMLEMYLMKGEQFQAVEVKDDGIVQWYPGGEENNITFDAAEEAAVVIYFRPAGNTAWDLNFFYIEVKETPEPPQPQGDELWVETFNRNGNEVLKKGTYWPYANEWFTGYNVSETQAVEGNQYTNDYTDVESNGVSIRPKKINGGDAVPGLYFAMNKEAAKNYVKFIGEPLFDASNKDYEYTLNFTICLPESADGGDLQEMNIYMNSLGLALLPKDTKLGDKLVTTDVAVPLENMKINDLQFDFDNTATQKFISKIWITAKEVGGVEPEKLEDGFYLVGTMNDWTPEASMMFVANEEVEGEYVMFWTGVAGEEMKVVEVKDNAIAAWYPDNADNFVVSDELVGQLMTIRFNPQGADTWTDFGGFCKVEVQGNPEPEAEFYIVGSFSNWEVNEDYKLVLDEESGEYLLDIKLNEGDELKAVAVLQGIQIWYPEGTDNNWVVDADHAGLVRIHFSTEEHSDWEFGYAYIELLETPPTPQGGEITIIPGDVTDIASGTTGDFEKTIKGVTVAWSGAYYNADNAVDFRVYANKTLTLTAEVNILKVEVIGLAKKGLELVVDNGIITTGASYESETTKSDWTDPLFVVEEINAKSITFSCNKQARFAAIRLTLEGGEVIEKLADGYYLAGDYNNWTPTDNDIFYLNEAVVETVEYMKNAVLAEGEGIKVVQYLNGEPDNWFPAGIDNNYIVDAEHAGEVVIYFRPEGNSDWESFHEGGFFYISGALTPGIITLDVAYGAAVYVDDDENGTFWQFNLYKDYDGGTGVVTYPDFYIGVAPKSTTAIAGTYEVSDIYFVEVDLDENTAVSATQASDLVVTHNEQGVYHFEFDFIGDDGATYMINAEVPVEAYDYASGEEIELKEEDTPEVLADGYYLAGDFNKWEVSADYMFKANPEAEGEYMLDVTLAEGDELKGVIVAFGQIVQWVGNPKDGGNNFKVDAEHAGDVTIYLNPAGRSDWEWTYIYIEVHAQPEYLTCADVLEIAATMEDPTADNKYVYGEEVVVRAYVQFAYDATEPKASPARKALVQSVWLNDDKAATKGQIQVYYGAVAEALAKGDFVEAKGQVVKYYKGENNIIVELLNGEMKKITDTPTGVETVETSVEVLKTIQNGQFIIIRNGQSFNATGARIQ